MVLLKTKSCPRRLPRKINTPLGTREQNKEIYMYVYMQHSRCGIVHKSNIFLLSWKFFKRLSSSKIELMEKV